MNLHPTTPLLLLALLLPAGVAAAQVSDVDRMTALNLAREAQEALGKKDFTTAADRFSRAESLVHAPTLLVGLARAQVGLGQWVSGLATYNRILREGVPDGAPPAYAKALEDARREVRELEARFPSVIIQIRGAADAKVTLDGAPVPSAALGVRRPVDPGKHVVRAEATGFATGEATVTVAEGKSEPVTLELKAGTAPLARLPLAPPPATGPTAPVAQPPATLPAPAEVRAAGSPRKTLGFASIGVGAAGLLVGAITGGLTLSKHGQLASACPTGACSGTSHHADIQTFHTLETVSTVGVIVGGVLAAAGVVLVVTAPKGRPTLAATLTPMLGLGHAALGGTF